MKHTAILFSAPMVRAILEGRKTQTRRVVKFEDVSSDEVVQRNGAWMGVGDCGMCNGVRLPLEELVCPYGKPGDRLWVRETCRAEELADGLDGVRYLADGAFRPIENSQAASDAWADMHAYRGREGVTVPPIHMPRWASRITLEIVAVRVERVQYISEADALAEGVGADGVEKWESGDDTPVGMFGALWDSINAERGYGWDANPWVWVIEFKRVQP